MTGTPARFFQASADMSTNRVTIATPGDGVVRLSKQQAMVIDP